MNELHRAPLQFLSIQHCPRGSQPEAYSNDDRVRAMRNARPVIHANTTFPAGRLPRPAPPAPAG